LNAIDWLNTPLHDFLSKLEKQEDGANVYRADPLGEGEAHSLMVWLMTGVEDAYFRLLSEEDFERGEVRGEVPLMRDGRRTYEELNHLTLADLPAILDTLVVLEEEYKQREREESERLAAERKERDRVRAKERRKLKKLGEW
jgi:hypothetical protein